MLVIRHQDQIVGGCSQTAVVKRRISERHGLRDFEPEGMKLVVEFVHEGLERRLRRGRDILKINADANTAMVPDKLQEVLDGAPARGPIGKHGSKLGTLPCHACRVEIIDQRYNLTGCEFSVAQELLVLAKVEGNSGLRE